MKPAAIIFDFDGVIVDSEVPANLALAECLTEIGLETCFEEALDRYCGQRWADCVRDIEGRLGHALPQDFEPIYLTRAASLMDRHLTAVCGIDAFLDRTKHLPLAIASSSEPEWIAHKLERVSLCHYFGDRLFSAAQLEHGKPYPDVYLHAAKGLGIAPERCLAIEDSAIGATAAVAAGMHVIGLCAASHIRNREAHAEMLRAVGVHRIAFGFDEIVL
jgi:HAD superfamily hydrolase (TIGR01509 family)